MRSALFLLFLQFVFIMTLNAQQPNFTAIWEKDHVSNILPSNVRHKDLQKYLADLGKRKIQIKEVGRSGGNREIYQMEFGTGPLKVFLWSQMHGDEPTATSALIDIYSVLQRHRDKDWVRQIEQAMTIRAVPMLNPDGAELYIRRNLQGIDINRDARSLQTPEAKLLKELRDEWSPNIGFNLHNQNALTAAGSSKNQAAISFLVVYGDAKKTSSEGLERNKRLVSAMVEALNKHIPQHIGRYADEYTATAFGDNFTAWGTPVILIETGALHGRDEMYLVKMNFIAIMTALLSIADGSEKNYTADGYEKLPANSSGRLMNVIFRNANVVEPAKSQDPVKTDIGLNTERRRAALSAPAIIKKVGTISDAAGLIEYDASNFIVVGRNQAVRPDSLGELLFYKRGRDIDWSSPELEKRFTPDAIFSVGRWIKGQGVVPLK